MSGKDIVSLLKETYQEFNEDKVPRLGAALAYYTLFSLAPLLVVVIAIAGLAFGEEAARGQIEGAMGGLVGQQGAEAIQAMIKGASHPASGILATILGLVTLLLGASGVFGELQDALNTIWEVTEKPAKGIVSMLRKRFFSFGLVVGTGFLLLVSMVITAGLQAFGKVLAGFMPGGDLFLEVLNFVISLAVTTLLFALIYKVLPDAKIAWRDVWTGAFVTAILFSIGRIAIGIYLGRSATASTYGAAGSLVIVVLWIYYSAQILFFGAEFTQVYANRFGSRVQPAPDAVPTTERQRLEEGMPRHRDVKVAAKKDESVEAAAEQRHAQGIHENPYRAREAAEQKGNRSNAVAQTVHASHETGDKSAQHSATNSQTVHEGQPEQQGTGGTVVSGAMGLAVFGLLKLLGRSGREQKKA
ncbi:MAG: YihY/virulence factor BrkB family protein [Anaerolineae bacterium]|nr:YihY/virulence factor BrkB family protein [Anaerolineae bacterium]